jgi:hypothetical protein
MQLLIGVVRDTASRCCLHLDRCSANDNNWNTATQLVAQRRAWDRRCSDCQRLSLLSRSIVPTSPHGQEFDDQPDRSRWCHCVR